MNITKYFKRADNKLSYDDVFNFLPKELTNIIIFYKKELEIFDYYEDFINYLIEVKKNDYETIFYWSFYKKKSYIKDIVKLININLNKDIEIIHYYRRKKIETNINRKIYRITIKLYKEKIFLFYL